jgi:hypothetical protein
MGRIKMIVLDLQPFTIHYVIGTNINVPCLFAWSIDSRVPWVLKPANAGDYEPDHAQAYCA